MKNNKILIVLISFFINACNNEKKIDNFYRLYTNGAGYSVVLDSLDYVIISEHVIDYRINDSFIIFSQIPIDSICECNHLCLERKYENYENLKTYELCKKAFKNSSLRKFWIIDRTREKYFLEDSTKYSNTFGPYSKEEFLIKRKGLNIPSEWHLNE